MIQTKMNGLVLDISYGKMEQGNKVRTVNSTDYFKGGCLFLTGPVGQFLHPVAYPLVIVSDCFLMKDSIILSRLANPQKEAF